MKDISLREIYKNREVIDDKWVRDLNRYGGMQIKLSELPTEKMMKELYDFLLDRFSLRAPRTNAGRMSLMNRMIRFISERMREFSSFSEMNREDSLHKYSVWLVQHGYRIYQSSERYTAAGKIVRTFRGEALGAFADVLDYCKEQDEREEAQKDIWNLDCLGIPILQGRNTASRLDFTGIPQPEIRLVVKKACLFELKSLKAATVRDNLTVMKRFCLHLNQSNPKVSSLRQITRNDIEEYLLYLNTEPHGRKSIAGEISALRNLLTLCLKIDGVETAENLFIDSDIPRRGHVLYRAYSDDEIRRINAAAVEHMPPQITRALFLQQLLGTRISDLLELKRDCIFDDNGCTMIRIEQPKTGGTYTKPVSKTIVELIHSCIQYTNEYAPDSDYIFMDENRPGKRYSYDKLQYHFRKMADEVNLVDDNGNRIQFESHMYRRTYGKALVDKQIDDLTISKLLGHRGTKTVSKYRKMSSAVLAEETKDMRKEMDRILSELASKW